MWDWKLILTFISVLGPIVAAGARSLWQLRQWLVELEGACKKRDERIAALEETDKKHGKRLARLAKLIRDKS